MGVSITNLPVLSAATGDEQINLTDYGKSWQISTEKLKQFTNNDNIIVPAIAASNTLNITGEIVVSDSIEIDGVQIIYEEGSNATLGGIIILNSGVGITTTEYLSSVNALLNEQESPIEEISFHLNGNLIPPVTSVTSSISSIDVVANDPGSEGNSITTTEELSGGFWNTATLTGGADDVYGNVHDTVGYFEQSPTNNQVNTALDNLELGGLRGGSTNQVLTKINNDDLSVRWSEIPSAPVTSVNGDIGAVVIDKDDLGLGTNDYVQFENIGVGGGNGASEILTVWGDTSLGGNVFVSNNLDVFNQLNVYESTHLLGSLEVDGMILGDNTLPGSNVFGDGSNQGIVIAEGSSLQLGDSSTPTKSSITFGDGGYTSFYEKFDDAFAISAGGLPKWDGSNEYDGNADVLYAGYNKNYSVVLGMLGDINSIDHGHFLRIDNRGLVLPTGNMGLGVSLPNEKLEVSGNAVIGGDLNLAGSLRTNSTASTNYCELQATDFDGYPRGSFRIGDADDSFNNGALNVTHNGASQIPFSIEVMTNANTIDNNTKRGGFRVTNSRLEIFAARGVGNDSDIPIGFYPSSLSGNEVLTLLPSGNVGIGTDAPSTKLDVAGDILAKNSDDSTTSISVGGGGEIGKLATGGIGITFFAYSGSSFDFRAGDGSSSSQNAIRVNSDKTTEFYGGVTITGLPDENIFTAKASNGSEAITVKDNGHIDFNITEDGTGLWRFRNTFSGVGQQNGWVEAWGENSNGYRGCSPSGTAYFNMGYDSNAGASGWGYGGSAKAIMVNGSQQLYVGTSVDKKFHAQHTISSSSTSRVSSVVTRRYGATVDLQRWQDEDDVTLASISSTGKGVFTDAQIVGDLEVDTDLTVGGDINTSGLVKGKFAGFRVSNTNTNSQAIPTSTWTHLTTCFDSVDFDPKSGWNNGTKRFQPTVAGYYDVQGIWIANFTGTNGVKITALYKNGSLYSILGRGVGLGGALNGFGGSDIVYMDGVNDYIQLWAYQASSINVSTFAQQGYNRFSATYLGE